MSTAMATPATGATLVGAMPTHLGPLVVATDGTTSADAAIRAAAQYAQRANWPVTVVAVLEPAPIVAADYGILMPPIETEQARQQALEQRVRAQIREIVGSAAANWTVEVRHGDPASTVARAARELDARLIVLGLGHHDLLDRLFGGETALHALRLARSPVLAVPQTFQHLPARIAIATDFSNASLAAGRTAIEMLPTLTMVYLAHVAPRLELQPEAYAAWINEYGTGVEPAFARLRAELNVPRGVTVETITLTGKPSRALLEFAKAAHLDAIVTGSRGAGLMDRILVGSTATSLIRGAHCTIFAVPTPLGAETATMGAVETVVPETEWSARLAEFTKRNAGRQATLEVDDPEIGAQSQQSGYPFLGAAYDHNDRRIEIMLGEQASTRHFTRGITDVRSVDLLQDAHGRDAVLRIAHGSGQTILTLVR
jgi:nucleotide-binding universal stress UspA family protein